jgi:uncharacterized protein YsxB (DUF464 family)
MIKIRLDFKKERLYLKAQGHAKKNTGQDENKKEFNLVCAACSALIKTFELSVTLLCRREPVQREEKSGFLKVIWEELAEKRMHTLLVLIRSFQIGLESIKKSYPESIHIEYNLEGIKN